MRRVILLAAGVGKRFGRITKKIPKCLIPLGKKGENLLSRYLEAFRVLGLKDIVIVVGHQKEKIKREGAQKGRALNIRFIENKDYRKGSILSLYCAKRFLNADCLVMDADVYFPLEALSRLACSWHKSCFLVDSKTKGTGEEMMLMARNGQPWSISKKIDPTLKILGEGVGFLKIQKKDALLLRTILEAFVRKNRVNGEYEETYDVLMKKRRVGVERMDGLFWTEMDFKEDLEKIKKHLKSARP